MVKSCYCMQAKIKHAHLFYLGLYILCDWLEFSHTSKSAVNFNFSIDMESQLVKHKASFTPVVMTLYILQLSRPHIGRTDGRSDKAHSDQFKCATLTQWQVSTLLRNDRKNSIAGSFEVLTGLQVGFLLRNENGCFRNILVTAIGTISMHFGVCHIERR